MSNVDLRKFYENLLPLEQLVERVTGLSVDAGGEVQVFSEDEIQAFVEYCAAAIASAPAVDDAIINDPPTLTKEEAVNGHGDLYHVSKKDSRGRAVKVRRNGKCKTWKTRPDEFSLPVKYGMYEAFRINEAFAREWTIHDPDEWPSGHSAFDILTHWTKRGEHNDVVGGRVKDLRGTLTLKRLFLHAHTTQDERQDVGFEARTACFDIERRFDNLGDWLDAGWLLDEPNEIMFWRGMVPPFEKMPARVDVAGRPVMNPAVPPRLSPAAKKVAARFSEFIGNAPPGTFLGPVKLVVDDDVALRPHTPRSRAATACDAKNEPTATVFIATKLLNENTQRIDGVLLHELGHAHLLQHGDVDHTEREADRAAEDIFDVHIFYDADDIQTTDPNPNHKRPRPVRLPK